MLGGYRFAADISDSLNGLTLCSACEFGRSSLQLMSASTSINVHRWCPCRQNIGHRCDRRKRSAARHFELSERWCLWMIPLRQTQPACDSWGVKRSEIVHIRHGSEFLGNIAPTLIEQAGEKAVSRQLDSNSRVFGLVAIRTTLLGPRPKPEPDSRR